MERRPPRRRRPLGVAARPARSLGFAMDAARDFVEERLGLLSGAGQALTASQQRRAEEDAVEEKNERATREGFALGRVVWFGGEGDYARDFLFHVENSHTLVSLLRGHAMHPFERFDRCCYVLCVLCLNLFLSAVVARDHGPVSRADGSVNYGGSRDYFASLTAASALNLFYDRALRLLATSPCVQRGGVLYDLCCLCRQCCVDLGKVGLYVALLVSFAVAVVGALVAADLDEASRRAGKGSFNVASTWVFSKQRPRKKASTL